jgi:hypothetical protein
LKSAQSFVGGHLPDETDALENTKQIAHEAEAIIRHAKRIESLVKAADNT